VEPDAARHAQYEDYYQMYRATYFALLPVFERVAKRAA
jgi:hypothetical protein